MPKTYSRPMPSVWTNVTVYHPDGTVEFGQTRRTFAAATRFRYRIDAAGTVATAADLRLAREACVMFAALASRRENNPLTRPGEWL